VASAVSAAGVMGSPDGRGHLDPVAGQLVLQCLGHLGVLTIGVVEVDQPVHPIL
jgi:hypothetical protein